MKTFIKETLHYLINKKKISLANTTFVLPSKRAGNFLKHHLKQTTQETLFAPEVLSIEDFLKKITQLKALDNTQSIFRLYESYKKLNAKDETESFETFYNWAQTLIHDFNEIDRYLIDAQHFFSYLSRIQDINHWSLTKKQTPLIKNYLKFWNKLPEYYQAFTRNILQKKEAYQGLMYRVASEEIEAYLENTNNQIIFIGFNALNNAEQKIIQTVLNKNKGEIFWDIDSIFFKDQHHEAGLFIRKYTQEWNHYQKENTILKWTKEHYQTPKNIQFFGIPKNIGQAKYVGNILSHFSEKQLTKTALVLGDEGLLPPMLNSLPQNVAKANITMGLPLAQVPLASLFELLFTLREKNDNQLYYKHVIEILSHPAMLRKLGNTSKEIQQKIIKNNLVLIPATELFLQAPASEILRICFDFSEETPTKILEKFQKLTLLLLPENASENNLNVTYLYQFNKLFKKLQNLIEEQSPVKTTGALHKIYTDTLSLETLDFSGSPFDGLQIMGMLETRVLDFENLIITSVNEGVLPAGKSNNSFIPFDLKKEYGLPTYKEKDAVYTYHFYRLLQRAKNIYLIYNTDQSGLNAGEKSRFITQLQVEQQPEHQHTKKLINPAVPVLPNRLKTIKKSPEIIAKLKALAAHGFSPSALTTYIRNPLDFYKNYVLDIRETDEVEETVAANTLGTVVHDTLEHFYKAYEGKNLVYEDVKKMLPKIETQVITEFEKTYGKTAINQGKNLIIFEIAKRYVANFLNDELKILTKNQLNIRQIETKIKTQITIKGLNFPIYLGGKVDRVDELNKTLRIIDYKTGKTEQKDLRISNWETIAKEYKYSKAFQVLCYTLMMRNKIELTEVEAGIISFKNLKNGFLKFTETTRKQSQVTPEILALFEVELKNLIAEIFNPEIPFEEKKV